MGEVRRSSDSSDLSFTPRPDRAREATSTGRKKDKSRHRASVACAACREKRIRCVVPVGRSECVQCQRTGNGCIIKNDDERRRPISRAYMNTLAQRVAQLENLLKENGTDPPPIAYPPKTTRGSLYMDGDSPPNIEVSATAVGSGESPALHHSRSLDASDSSSHGLSLVLNDSADGQIQAQEKAVPIKDRDAPDRGSSAEHLSLDRRGGVLNAPDEVDNAKTDPQSTGEQRSQGERVIGAVPLGTQQYLLQLFWQHYNAVLHVVHEAAFTQDLEHGETQFYSMFLHVCILAMGFRFADKTRADVQRIALSGRDSILHREAKHMLDHELEHPGGIPSVAALLILGDCEVGAGREHVGWMYSGMAIRLAYDRGLHLDMRSTSTSEKETEVRRLTLWACVIYDRYWSIFLDRPTSMKSCDLEVYSLTSRFERLGTSRRAGDKAGFHTQIYEALLDLMDVAGRVIEGHRRGRHDPNQASYAQMISLDRELRSWAARLPPELQYTEDTRANAPFSFYYLHQQYHAILIHLHRPFTARERSKNNNQRQADNIQQHDIETSRSICTESAIAIALLFRHHRQRFDGREIFTAAAHHAGVAATALVASVASRPDFPERAFNMQCLEILHAALQDTAQTYAPAEKMATIIQAAILDLKRKRPSPEIASRPQDPLTSARKNSRTMDSHAERPAVKRRQTTHRRENSRQRSNTTSHSSSVISAPTQDSTPGPPSTGGLTMFPPQSQAEPVMWSTPMDSTPVFHPQRPIPTPFQLQDTPPLIHNPALNGPYWTSGSAPHALPVYPPQHMSSTPSDMPIPVDSEMTTFNFLLPSEDDWARWHAGTAGGDVATDLDGFPPRSRLQEAEGGPPVGEIVKG